MINQNFLRNLYDAFNKDVIETVISMKAENVKRANSLEGSYIFVCENVREYLEREV